MRAKSDPWFAEYLVRIGKDADLDKLIDSVFPMLNANLADPNYITSRAILSKRNECMDTINMKMIGHFRGDEMVYHSFDRAEDDRHNYYPPEFLNSLTPNRLPSHVLKLKVNGHVILLRNIDPANGLCNGTRLVVRVFQRNAIDAEIMRKQFPIRLSFAMKINKAQGKTIPNVGVYLPQPVFSHGQLYIILSRATARRNIKILVTPDDCKKKEKRSKMSGTCTNNIIYKEVLTP
ncbi:uncharacterized protein LOC133930144 [Phragmites australis]|uniref:uncharacterized protein LOC133930144 n=1 Tax=Phragmites australis TaxID=29695 RepID=UPI002D7721F8|nr:uncharacterized protein LOC133930144 [Phragmites australis]